MEPQTDLTGISWLRFLLAASTVIGLMGLLAWSLKAIAARGWITPPAGRTRRLKIIESLPLDARHRLVIIKCDEAQHLLLLGASHDTVVLTNLPATSSPLPESTAVIEP
ncbi:MAG: flagellar biosynthetic protein FliO [Alphaproteobacteria bacterium]|nr:flagellar biosynthetic protein FliO [Alphaproteobacteria bacterium]